MTTAMIRCLRNQFPNAQIDMVVRKDFLDLIKDNPRLNQKKALARGEGVQGLLELYSWIKEQDYDVIYDAHQSLRTLILMPFLKARHKFYFQKHYLKRSLALTFKLPLLKNFGRFLERYLLPLRPLGVNYDGKGPELFISDKTLSQVALKFPITQTSQTKVGLIPSAQWPGKRWPLSNFRELIEKMIVETPYHFILFGGREDHFCQDLVRELPSDRISNLQGKCSIEESGAILKSCEFVIANDTGLMHMADALKKPSILFLGPTSREMGCLPFHPKSIILEKEMWCRPCSKNGQAPCIRKERYCLTEISSEMALNAVKRMGQSLSL